MARSIWSGAITFSMISIPVKLYGAAENKDLKFTTLHAECNSRVKEKVWCPVDDREIFGEERIRVYEYAKNDYVPVTDDDQASMPLASKSTIAVSSFVNSTEVDPVYYEKSYNVEAEPAGTKPYALLLRVLRTRGVAAVAKIAMRNKESLCLLRAGHGNVIVLNTLYYPDEVRSLDQPDVLISQAELDMALSLVEMLQAPFDPSQYHDGYRQAMLNLIQAKHDGEAIVSTPYAAEAPPTVDLMAALQASVNATRARRASADLSDQAVAI